jgi:hypothetical protein
MEEFRNQENILLIFQKIIEQESKTSTYKFALLRAVIDIITAQSPHIEERTEYFGLFVKFILLLTAKKNLQTLKFVR